MSVLITFIKLIAVFDLLVIAVYFGGDMGRPKRNRPPDLQNAGCLLQARRRWSSRFDESER